MVDRVPPAAAGADVMLPLPDPDPRRAAILGGGARGAQWAARFLTAGWEVVLFDPDPGAGAAVLARFGTMPGHAPGRFQIAARISEAVAGALWIGDCVPDRLALKRKLYQQVQAHCRPDAVIVATTTTFAVSALQSCATRPGQILAVDATPAQGDPKVITLHGGKFSRSDRLQATLEILRGLGLTARIGDAEPRTT